MDGWTDRCTHARMQSFPSEWLQGEGLQSESQLLGGFPVAGDELSCCQDESLLPEPMKMILT